MKDDYMGKSALFKAERAKVAKLEGWLKYLYYYYLDGSDDRLPPEEQAEISDYIKEMEGK